MVEQLPLKQLVLGSNPSGPTKKVELAHRSRPERYQATFSLPLTRRHRLSVRTSPFHGGKRGSTPLGATKRRSRSQSGFFFCIEEAEENRVRLACILHAR
jgi:hypothetical protein